MANKILNNINFYVSGCAGVRAFFGVDKQAEKNWKYSTRPALYHTTMNSHCELLPSLVKVSEWEMVNGIFIKQQKTIFLQFSSSSSSPPIESKPNNDLWARRRGMYEITRIAADALSLVPRDMETQLLQKFAIRGQNTRERASVSTGCCAVHWKSELTRHVHIYNSTYLDLKWKNILIELERELIQINTMSRIFHIFTFSHFHILPSAQAWLHYK